MMQGNDTPSIAIAGTGLIGRAWAVAFARGGCDVRLYDSVEGAAENALTAVKDMAEDLHRADMLGGASVADLVARVSVSDTLEAALAGADHVQESIPERVEIKRAFYALLDDLAEPDAILASSTSALLPSAFTEGLNTRHRCVVAHPINPPSLIPAVEIVPAPWTDPEAVERCAQLMERIGQKPIRMKKEIDGFIMNRLQGALLQEAFRLVEDGVASPEDVDIGIAHGLAPRWALMGPFETIDLNAPGGVADYVARYAGMYELIGKSQGRMPAWSGALLDRVTKARRDVLPLDGIADSQSRRDKRLMALMRHLRDTDTGTDK
jgi:L-gulonate 3-dehydrogenase